MKNIGGMGRDRKIKPHKNLVAWQKSMDLVQLVYEFTRKFPKEEMFGLVSQMRRAVVSAPSNIAEGAADRSNNQFINFLSIAIGSLNELDTQTEIAFRLNYLSGEEFGKLSEAIDTCLALTYGLKKSVKSKQ